jgi:alkylation response protein AidB-like acyl-CoA dehydrogenase
MNLAMDEAERSIRDEVRSFLATNTLRPDDLSEDLDERIAELRDWQRKLYDAGLVGIAWPRDLGGRGGTASQQIVANLELAAAGAPEPVGVIGLEVVGPSILAYGSPEQLRAYVPRILTAQDIWCQGFSEPDAGSDLAALKTRAEDHGDHFVITGQKTWTSYAQYARWCAVLARTDVAVAPHRGISYLIVDMRSPGVEVRPLKQITGDAEFAEVFFDGVEVPAENVIGEPNEGWAIAMHTLTHERGPAVAGRQAKLRVLLDRLIEHARTTTRDGSPAIDHPEVVGLLARSHIALEVLRHQTYRSMGQAVARGRPGLESSVDKVWLATAEQQLGETCLDVLGPHTSYSDASPDGRLVPELQNAYLYGRAASVYGGSIQIQRNIIAARTLGLPRD